jgi:hypothetical protein
MIRPGGRFRLGRAGRFADGTFLSLQQGDAS